MKPEQNDATESHPFGLFALDSDGVVWQYENPSKGWTAYPINIPELTERTAQLIAHRVCCGTEHDPPNGKLHGFCVICGVPWPCEYAGKPAKAEAE